MPLLRAGDVGDLCSGGRGTCKVKNGIRHCQTSFQANPSLKLTAEVQELRWHSNN